MQCLYLEPLEVLKIVDKFHRFFRLMFLAVPDIEPESLQTPNHQSWQQRTYTHLSQYNTRGGFQFIVTKQKSINLTEYHSLGISNVFFPLKSVWFMELAMSRSWVRFLLGPRPPI